MLVNEGGCTQSTAEQADERLSPCTSFVGGAMQMV